MKFLKRLSETIFAILPIMAIIIFVQLFLFDFGLEKIRDFLIGVVLVVFGETLLLTGIDSTIMPMGNFMVGSVNKPSKFVSFILFAVIFGIFATIAEPDVSILVSQVKTIGVSVNGTLLLLSIGLGVGVCIAISIFCILKKINVKYLYLTFFTLIFLVATQVKSDNIAIAFDAGGATTGIVAAPFMLAIASGVGSKIDSRGKNSNSFGVLGLSSIGPVLIVLLLFAFSKGNAAAESASGENVSIFLTILKYTTFAILPLAAIFFVYDLLYIKLPMNQKLNFMLGLFVTFLGLYLFLLGIEFGFTNIGSEFGVFLRTQSISSIILFCVIIGFIITFSEPAVVVLSKQVERETRGNISNIVVLIFIAISMTFAVTITALKIIYNINFFYIILIGYFIALILMFFVPSMFTNLAFDSGGVASGPMASAFLLPIMISFAAASGDLNGFGVLGIIGMMPIIVIQILGLIYKFGLIKVGKEKYKSHLNYNYTANLYSNIEFLEMHHNQLMMEKENERKK